jgi:hypothetical protein
LLTIEISQTNELEFVFRGYTANTEKPIIVSIAHLPFWQSVFHPKSIFKYLKRIIEKVKGYEEHQKKRIVENLIKNL